MPWYNASWGYRQKITVQSAQVDADITGFPIYVDLSDMQTGFFTNVKSDGSDIVVTESDGETKLKRELVFITTGSSIGELHFKGDILSGSNVDFYIYYGNAGASETNDADTWDGDYECVHHMQVQDSITDSTVNNQDGVESGAIAQQAGKLSGYGNESDGDDYFTITDGLQNMMGNEDAISVSLWYKETGTTPQYTNIFEGENLSDFGLRVQPGITDLIFAYNQSGAGTLDAIVTDLWDGSWHQMVFTRVAGSPGTAELLIDGSSEDTDNSWPATDAFTDLDFNIFWSGSWQGIIDEFRVSSIERASTWISTQHSNQNDPDNFYTASAQETAPVAGNPWYYYAQQ